MATRLRKVRKLRGSRTHGWGVSGQHRGIGMRGGHGKAGWCKHKWTFTVKYGRDRIGKKGFRNPTSEDLRVLNLSQLEDLIHRLEASDERLSMRGDKYFIDLKALGYDKLLGKGRIETPVIVSVPGCSAKAREKLEEIGGAVAPVDQAPTTDG
ncbi:MAG: uL15 family ribosomal protein [Candidatus Bathyarchaeia archaeon]|nr:uL15 family ribosomal protein [Candidatus Bathyarchaeota archaeon]